MKKHKLSETLRTEMLERLRRGNEFHKLIQEEWLRTAGGHEDNLIKKEHACTKPTRDKGRMDVYYAGGTEPDPEITAIVEIKCTDWDRMSVKAVKRNVKRQINQIWSYIDSEEEAAKQTCPGIIFSKTPADPVRRAYIEKMFHEGCIQLVWHDETAPINPPDPVLADLLGKNER